MYSVCSAHSIHSAIRNKMNRILFTNMCSEFQESVVSQENFPFRSVLAWLRVILGVQPRDMAAMLVANTTQKLSSLVPSGETGHSAPNKASVKSYSHSNRNNYVAATIIVITFHRLNKNDSSVCFISLQQAMIPFPVKASLVTWWLCVLPILPAVNLCIPLLDRGVVFCPKLPRARTGSTAVLRATSVIPIVQSTNVTV